MFDEELNKTNLMFQMFENLCINMIKIKISQNKAKVNYNLDLRKDVVSEQYFEID